MGQIKIKSQPGVTKDLSYPGPKKLTDTPCIFKQKHDFRLHY